MICQETTIKVTYLTKGNIAMTLEEHVKKIRGLVEEELPVKVVRCEAIGQAEWEDR